MVLFIVTSTLLDPHPGVKVHGIARPEITARAGPVFAL